MDGHTVRQTETQVQVLSCTFAAKNYFFDTFIFNELKSFLAGICPSSEENLESLKLGP